MFTLLDTRSGDVHFAASSHTVTYCSETTLIHGPSGTLVGEDELGNRYYENNDNQIGKDSLR